jgi:hypothetical protein
MTLAATYDPVLSRVRLAGTFLSPAAYAVFDRTTDGVRYTTVRGGTAVSVVSQNANADDYEFPAGVPITYRLRGYSAADALLFTNSATITQDVNSAWLKVPAAPFLNTEVDVSVRLEISRRGRGGIFDVVGRSNPVAVGDIRGSKEFTLQLRTETASQERDLDYALSTGDVIYLQTPASQDQFPSGYFTVGDISRTPEDRYTERRIWSLDLAEVAAPGPDVVGSAYTCASVLFEYATVTDVIADNATIADLLNRTGTPSEVIVP